VCSGSAGGQASSALVVLCLLEVLEGMLPILEVEDMRHVLKVLEVVGNMRHVLVLLEVLNYMRHVLEVVDDISVD